MLESRNKDWQRPEWCLAKQGLSLAAERVFFRDVEALSTSPVWTHLPPESVHWDTQTLAFRMISRMSTVVHELLVAPTSLCPLALWRILLNPEEAESMQTLPQCMLDDFSQAFFQRYPGPLATSPEAKQVLQVMAQMSYTDTVTIEWSHGRVSRSVRQQAVQTHTPTLSYINGQMVSKRFWQRKVTASSFPSFRRRGHASQRPRPAVGQVVKKSKKAGGGGGTFRAFVSVRTRGQKRRPAWQSLAAEYRAVKEAGGDEVRRLARMGQAATAYHRQTRLPSFGPAPRLIARKRQRQVAYSRAGQRLVPTSLAPRVAREDEAGGSMKYDLPLGPLLHDVRRQVRQRALQKSHTRKQAAQEMQRFVDAEQDEAVAALLSIIPEAGKFSDGFQLIPDRQCRSFDFCPNAVPEATRAAEWAAANSKKSNLQRALQNDWSMKNALVCEPLPEDLPKAVGGRRPPRCCWEGGLCTHSLAGRQVAQFRARVHERLKERFPSRQDPTKKKQLQDGWVVLQLQPDQECDDPGHDMLGWHRLMSAQEAEVGANGAAAMYDEVFVHIGLHYFKPYRSTYELLIFQERVSDSRVKLKKTFEFSTEIQLFSKLDLDRPWTMRVLQIVSSLQPVAICDPTVCLVDTSTAFEKIWPPPMRQRRLGLRRMRAASRRGAGANLGSPEESQSHDQPAPEGEEAEGGAELEAVQEAEGGEWSEQEDSGSEGEDEYGELEAFLEEAMQQGHAASMAEVGVEAVPAEAGAGGQQAADQAEDLVSPAAVAVDDALAAEAGGLAVDDAQDDAEVLADNRPVEPALLRPPEAVDTAARREPAEKVCFAPGGKITWYRQGFFTAMCDNALHGKCVLSRSSKEGRKAPQGRPLGLLTAWLMVGGEHMTKEGHWLKTNWTTLAQRQEARDMLHQLEGGPGLLEEERPLRAGEGPEPDLLP